MTLRSLGKSQTGSRKQPIAQQLNTSVPPASSTWTIFVYSLGSLSCEAKIYTATLHYLRGRYLCSLVPVMGFSA